MAIHIGLKEFTATLSDAALACSLVNAQKPAMPAAYRPVSTTCMSHREARRTYAGVRFDMRMTGIFALCAVLVPQVAASYGVRLSAIPETYWGTWVPAAEVCQDANKSAIVLSAKGYVTSAVNCAVNYVAETPSPIYSAQLQCSNMAGPVAKKVVNLIIRPAFIKKIEAEGSNPPTPATQCGLCGVISGCVRTADIKSRGVFVNRLFCGNADLWTQCLYGTADRNNCH
jgi:hypothetical protein